MEILYLLDLFYEHCLYFRNYSKETIKGYKGAFNLFLKDTNVKHIEEVTQSIIQEYFYNGRAKRKWSSVTFRNYRKTLLPFFKWCIKNGYLRENPFNSMELPRVEKREIKVITLEQAYKLLEFSYNYPHTYGGEFLQHRNRAIIGTFLYAGLRKGELLKLRLMDVDFKRRCIFVNQGKGAKDRTVPLLPELYPYLQSYLQERKRRKKTCPEFFASFYLNQGFTCVGLDRFISFLRKEVGFYFRCHMLRATFATFMAEGGCNPYALRDMMGHENIETTMKHYIRVNFQHVQQEAQKHLLGSYRPRHLTQPSENHFSFPQSQPPVKALTDNDSHFHSRSSRHY